MTVLLRNRCECAPIRRRARGGSDISGRLFDQVWRSRMDAGSQNSSHESASHSSDVTMADSTSPSSGKQERSPEKSTPKKQKTEHLKDFEICAELQGHKKGVRDVAVFDDNLIATCEEYGTVHLWQRCAPNQFKEVSNSAFPRTMHNCLTYCITSIHGEHFATPTFASGGRDKVARVWTADGKTFSPLAGHEADVNSISQTASGDIITGSWDGTARVWSKGKCVKVLGGPEQHQYAVVVCGLSTGEIVTGSANGSLHIWSADGTLKKSVVKAHGHAVKAIVPHPLGFATCGNDGVINIWTNQGEVVVRIVDAHHAGNRSVRLRRTVSGAALSNIESGHARSIVY